MFVTKFVGRKEADRVGSWRLRYVYLRQINSHRCALCVTRKHQLSRSSPRSLSVFVPTVSLWQLVRSSLHSVSPWTAVPRRLLSGLHANYYNQTQVILILHLTHLLTAVSWVFLPLQTSLNHAPSPHTPTARLRPGSSPACSPPPPIPGEEVGYSHLVPGLWITLNLKGCNARYQRVIRALVSFMRWSHCKGAWSEQRVNSRPRR